MTTLSSNHHADRSQPTPPALTTGAIATNIIMFLTDRTTYNARSFEAIVSYVHAVAGTVYQPGAIRAALTALLALEFVAVANTRTEREFFTLSNRLEELLLSV